MTETVITKMHATPTLGEVRIIRRTEDPDFAVLDLGAGYGPGVNDIIRSGITFIFDPADLPNVAATLRAMADEAERIAPRTAEVVG